MSENPEKVSADFWEFVRDEYRRLEPNSWAWREAAIIARERRQIDSGLAENPRCSCGDVMLLRAPRPPKKRLFWGCPTCAATASARVHEPPEGMAPVPGYGPGSVRTPSWVIKRKIADRERSRAAREDARRLRDVGEEASEVE